MEDVPCENCIVFAICNSKVREEGATKLVIIGLSVECKILSNFLTRYSTRTISLSDETLSAVRRVFGWESFEDKLVRWDNEE